VSVWRPLSSWPGERTPASERRKAPFEGTWRHTLNLLEHELGELEATQIVFELAGITEADLKLDGGIRANAKVDDPGVVVSFQSRHGPLRYAVDTFTDWRQNLRAIALALQGLRRMEVYGVAKSGEQYRGWRALEARVASREDARAELREYLRPQEPNVDRMDDRALRRRALRLAHPDTGRRP
jgi:hypothetical protein